MNETRNQYVTRINGSRLDSRLKELFIKTGPLGDCIEEGEEFDKICQEFTIDEHDLIVKTTDGFLLFYPELDCITLIDYHKGYYKIYAEFTFQEYIDESN